MTDCFVMASLFIRLLAPRDLPPRGRPGRRVTARGPEVEAPEALRGSLRRHRLLTVALLAALAGSLGLNWALFREAKHYYLLYNGLQLDPLGLAYYPSPPPAPAGGRRGPRVLFYGDSRAVEWSPPAAPAHVEFVNRGVSGQTSAGALLRFDLHAAPARPDVVVIQVGINDLKAVALFPDRERRIVADCEERIGRLVAKARDAGAGVILTTIFPTGPVPPERRPFWSPEIRAAIERVNARIRALGADRVLVLDAHALLEERGEVRPAYARDTLHLNPAGYDVLNRELSRLLARLLQGRS
jgi:lysophospholipase L1-like esterase